MSNGKKGLEKKKKIHIHTEGESKKKGNFSRHTAETAKRAALPSTLVPVKQLHPKSP